MARRVVVTGGSVITALGFELSDFWDRLCSGKSGITTFERFDSSDLKVKFAGEIKDFSLSDHTDLTIKDARRLDRFSQFAMAAAHKSIHQSQADFTKEDPFRCGVLVGSGIGGLQEIEAQHSNLFGRGSSRVSPFMIPKIMVNAAGGNISVNWGLKGPNIAIATACASATNAIGDAFKLIQHDVAEIMVTGGTEAPITPMGVSGFARMKALSTRNDEPERASRPFDMERDGFVLAEGAGLVVLEEREHAIKRGAPIFAEVLGYGVSADASHITAPDPTGAGASYAMTQALKDAKLNLDDIDYVNAHGTSTPLGDKAETFALKKVFESHAKKMAVSSTKSQLGHLLGASGGVEFIVGMLALQNQVIPPTINLENPDPDCDLDYVPDEPRETKVNYVLSNSFGFGGHNACLVLGRAT